IDIFCYEDINTIEKSEKRQGKIDVKQVSSVKLGPIVVYNPFVFLDLKYDTLVLMLNFLHLTSWLLLILKPLHRKKIILWGHGISVKRYINEQQKPSIFLKWMIYFADEIWFYTDQERSMWAKIFPLMKAVSLNNTISDVDEILILPELDKQTLRNKYQIRQPIIFIFCARFTNPYRRIDLLLSAINRLDTQKFGFIIIGDGKLKPDLSNYKNVYDFGSVYDKNIKRELFQMSDIYFQPGWVGLSIVEALAYGKPIATFRRSPNVLQCVEYGYIKDGFNGWVFDDLSDFVEFTSTVHKSDILTFSENAREYARENLRMGHMVNAAVSTLL
ncbi:glycosyltransferase, partial [Dyadobacter sp.]|uniref:glycosyltransferase n=1 Tax=Dyadobacter sp. TaxID=1914288 RepID=UPI003F6F884C